MNIFGYEIFVTGFSRPNLKANTFAWRALPCHGVTEKREWRSQ
jgi:hypothetical protein